MRVLLSAFACEPNHGSEFGIGWNIACELARLGHEVAVLASGWHHREKVEQWLAAHPETPPLRFVWHDVPGWQPPPYNDARYLRIYYNTWQLTARRRVRELLRHERFDVIQHVTWGAWRWPSHLAGLGPAHIFGPVGGGLAPPWRLRASFPGRAKFFEYARDLGNFLGWLNPRLWLCLARTDLMLATDIDSKRWVHPWWRHKVEVMSQIACFDPPAHVLADPVIPPGPGLRLLAVGRVEWWKGLFLALPAFRDLRKQDPRARFTIIGKGPDHETLRQLAQSLGVLDAIDWIDFIPNHELQAVYRRHDLLVFPSFHDLGGVAVAEAMTNGLPAIVLDREDEAGLIDASCGRRVPIAGRSQEAVEAAMGEILIELASDPALRARLRQGAVRRAQERSWAALARAFSSCYDRLVQETVPGPKALASDRHAPAE